MTISGAVMQGGQALSPDGALYVKLDSGSAITGTTITAATKFVAADGSVAAPSYTFSSATDLGFSYTSGNLNTSINGNARISINDSNGVRYWSGMKLAWTDSASNSNAGDAFITRYAAKQLMISGDGTGATTNAGLILGYTGTTGQSAIWSSTLVPSSSNYAFWTDGASAAINASSGGEVRLQRNGSSIIYMASTSGSGLVIATDSATTDVNALSRTQTWNGSGVAFKANRTVITNTASAVGSMHESWEYSTGQGTGVLMLTELTTIAAAATTDTTIQMPAGALVIGVSVRVTTVIPTATNFTVGDSGSAARFSTAAVSSAANSTDRGTKAGCYYNASALAVRITPDATPGDNSGRVRVTIHYLQVTPPTS